MRKTEGMSEFSPTLGGVVADNAGGIGNTICGDGE